MSLKRCPGSMAFSQPKIELVRCPNCGDTAEVWSDEAEGKCIKCGHAVCRTTTQSCIDWCKYAKECLGEEAHKRYQDMKTRLRKESLLKAAARYLPDGPIKERAQARVTYAEQILRQEAGADPNVVMATTALLDCVGPAATGEASGSILATIQDALQELGYPEGFIKEVSTIVTGMRERHKPGSINASVVQDADNLARLAAGPEHAETIKPTQFSTVTGAALAEQHLRAARFAAR